MENSERVQALLIAICKTFVGSISQKLFYLIQFNQTERAWKKYMDFQNTASRTECFHMEVY